MELEQLEDQIVVNKSGHSYLFKPLVIEEVSLPYYMLVLKKHNPYRIYFINNEFDAFVNIFKDILKN
jgi:hypothetical protein